MNPFRALARYIFSKLFHRHARIAWGAYVGHSSTMGSKVRVDTEALLIECHLGDHVRVGEYSSLIRSSVERYSRVYAHCVLEDVSLGSFSFIAEGSRLGGVRIGRFCSLGPQVIIGYGDHPTAWISTSPAFYSTREQCGYTFATQDYFEEKKPISIGHDVWLGARVFVRDGVSIGNGAIVGAGAVVVDDIPEFAIVVGCPAKVIRYRFDGEIRQRIAALQWWNWDIKVLENYQELFRQPDPENFLRSLEIN